MSENRTVQPILQGDNDAKIIETLNHNFQVLTERIKEANLELSYLDVLKISSIYTTDEDDSSDWNDNLQQFVATCWNVLANYHGVYIQHPEKGRPLFEWHGQAVRNGDVIIKLPNNQWLYLPGATPKYYIPQTYQNQTITYKLADDPESEPVSVTLPDFPTGALAYEAVSVASEASFTYPSDYRSIRFYDEDNEEVIIDTFPAPSTPAMTATFANPCNFPITVHIIKDN